MALVGHRIADQGAVGLGARQAELEPAVLAHLDVDERVADFAAVCSTSWPFSITARPRSPSRSHSASTRSSGNSAEAAVNAGNGMPRRGLEAVLEHARGVVLGVVLGVGVAHHQPAQALAEILEAPGAGDAHDCGEHGDLGCRT